MREIRIQTNTSENHKRKNLSIVEMINQQGFVAKAEKKFVYYVSDQGFQPEVELAPGLVEAPPNLAGKKDRHVWIKKIFDNKTGTSQMIYRVIGSFYVVQNLHVFAVVFMHSIKFDILSGSLPKMKI